MGGGEGGGGGGGRRGGAISDRRGVKDIETGEGKRWRRKTR